MFIAGDCLPLDLVHGYSIELTPPPPGEPHGNGPQPETGTAKKLLVNAAVSPLNSVDEAQRDLYRPDSRNSVAERMPLPEICRSPKSQSLEHQRPERGNRQPQTDGHENLTVIREQLEEVPHLDNEAWYPKDGPSLLGRTYMASQGGGRLLVGATKTKGLTPDQALQAQSSTRPLIAQG